MPVFYGSAEEIFDETSLAEFYAKIVEAAENYWPMIAHTGGDSSETLNECGLKNQYSYTIVTTFTMETRRRRQTTVHNMMLMRSPDGTNEYSGEWSRDDNDWNNDLIEAIPFGFDPSSRWITGFFVVPETTFLNGACFESYEIAHLRSREGYRATWYDELGA